MRALRIRMSTLAAGACGLALLAGAGACETLGFDSDRDRLQEARELWQDRGVRDYRLDVRRLCFCGYDVTRAVRVTVRSGVVVSRTYVDDGTVVGEAPGSFAGLPELFPDVEGLFAVVEDALDRDADQLDVTYDAEFGVPLNIVIDYRRNTADEELTFQAEAFTELPASG